MRSLLVVSILAVAAAMAVHPVDIPCVTWIPSTSSTPTPNPDDLFIAAYTWVLGTGGRDQCTGMGDVIPCFSNQEGNYNWGHHDYDPSFSSTDYCRNWVDGTVSFANNFYLPKKGPYWKTWKWQDAVKGGPVPDNAIRYGPSVMARSKTTGPGSCFGKGFTGWALGQDNGTFGSVHFSIAEAPYTTDSFEVAVCEAYIPTKAPPTPAPWTPAPWTPTPLTPVPPTPVPFTPVPPTPVPPTPVPPTPVPPTPVPPTPVPPTPVPPTPVPPTPVPPTPVPPTPVPPTPVPPTPVPPTPVPTTMSPVTTFSPTLPPNNKPYIRFANTVPSANNITATITQGSITYTWTDYSFGEFSNWVEIFAANVPGTITLKSGGRTLLSTSVILTPGPLVVAVKDMWPPIRAYNVETIAASYVPPTSGSGARLFNLSPDTVAASMSRGGTTLVSDILYADGSEWAAIPKGMGSFTVTDYISGATLATDSFSAPPAPFVFTNFLIGLKNTTGTSSSFGTRLVPLADAPEF